MANCSLQKSLTSGTSPVPWSIHVNTAAKGLGLVVFPESKQRPSSIRPFKVKPILPKQISDYLLDELQHHRSSSSPGCILTRYYRMSFTFPKARQIQKDLQKTDPRILSQFTSGRSQTTSNLLFWASGYLGHWATTKETTRFQCWHYKRFFCLFLNVLYGFQFSVLIAPNWLSLDLYIMLPKKWLRLKLSRVSFPDANFLWLQMNDTAC